MQVASTWLMLSGIWCRLTSWATLSSAIEPQSIRPQTRSPGLKRSAPGPVSITTPETSQPATKGRGGLRWYWPETSRLSAKLTPMAWVLSFTSFGPGVGEGISLSSS